MSPTTLSIQLHIYATYTINYLAKCVHPNNVDITRNKRLHLPGMDSTEAVLQ